MKKLLVVLLALTCLGAIGFAQQAAAGPSVSYHLNGFWVGNYDPNSKLNDPTENSGQQRVWPTFDIAFDPNNTMEIGLRLPQTVGVNVPSSSDLAGSLWHWMWTSDLTASAGMKDSPVDLKLTIGIMDSVLTNWWYDNNGWEWEYGGPSNSPGRHWDALLTTINGDSNFMGYGLSAGVGPVTLHWVNDFSLKNTLVGAEASLMGLGLFASYGVYQDYGGAGSGNLALEAKYDVPAMGDLTLKPSAFFRDGLYNSSLGGGWAFGVDVTVGYQAFKVVVGATTTSDSTLQHASVTGFYNVTSAAQVWVGAYLDGSSGAQSALQAVDIGASYTFGSFKLMVGYVVGGTDQTNTVNGVNSGSTNGGNEVTLGNDNVGSIANGVYFGSAIAF